MEVFIKGILCIVLTSRCDYLCIWLMPNWGGILFLRYDETLCTTWEHFNDRRHYSMIVVLEEDRVIVPEIRGAVHLFHDVDHLVIDVVTDCPNRY